MVKCFLGMALGLRIHAYSALCFYSYCARAIKFVSSLSDIFDLGVLSDFYDINLDQLMRLGLWSSGAISGAAATSTIEGVFPLLANELVFSIFSTFIFGVARSYFNLGVNCSLDLEGLFFMFILNRLVMLVKPLSNLFLFYGN